MELIAVSRRSTGTGRFAVEEARANPTTAEEGRRVINLSVRRAMTQLRGERYLGAKKKHLEASIAHMRVLRQRLNSLTHQGRGLARRQEKRSDGIKWGDLSSAFASRLRTETIVNLHHVDALTFLEHRVRFCARWGRSSLTRRLRARVGQRRRTGTQTLLDGQPGNASTDIAALWSQHVQDDVIGQLEDFQQRASGWKLYQLVQATARIKLLPFAAADC